jgi:hypothetical protein
MQHHSSTFFISEKSSVIPKFYSMTTPSLTLDGHHSIITLHFESFEMIRSIIAEITTLLNIQEEKYTNA